MHPNDVKVVIKNFPLNFHKQARDAAKYALASDRQKICGSTKNESCYKEMYHMIMADFRKLIQLPSHSKFFFKEISILEAERLLIDYQNRLNNIKKLLIKI